MPEVDEHATSLRDQASEMRRLSAERAAADHLGIAAKLTEFAAELETKAADLERSP
jgi:hypothetical protein